MSDFQIGLQVTAIGMGLVFLTLILIMLIIMLLDRVFRVKQATMVEEPPVLVARAAAPAAESPLAATPSVATEDDTDLVAVLAVAVVSALEGAVGRAVERAAPPQIDYGNLPAEVVTVARIDPGPSTWSGQGRLSALN